MGSPLRGDLERAFIIGGLKDMIMTVKATKEELEKLTGLQGEGLDVDALIESAEAGFEINYGSLGVQVVVTIEVE